VSLGLRSRNPIIKLYDSNRFFRAAVQKLGFSRKGLAEFPSERFVEYLFVFKNLDASGGKALDVGSGISLFPLALASFGFEVTTIDLKSYAYSSLLPNIKPVVCDIRKTSFPDNHFDIITAVSTIEHIGLGRYGDTLDWQGDKKAVHELVRILKPGGVFFITLPFGKKGISYLHRVYDYDSLTDLLRGLTIVCESFFTQKGEIWIVTNSENIAGVDPTFYVQGIACVKAVKSKRHNPHF